MELMYLFWIFGWAVPATLYIWLVPEDDSRFLAIIPVISMFGYIGLFVSIRDRWEHKGCRWIGHKYVSDGGSEDEKWNVMTPKKRYAQTLYNLNLSPNKIDTSRRMPMRVSMGGIDKLICTKCGHEHYRSWSAFD